MSSWHQSCQSVTRDQIWVMENRHLCLESSENLAKINVLLIYNQLHISEFGEAMPKLLKFDMYLVR